jgi:hypothetical protein
VGLDGTGFSTSDRISSFKSTWSWSKSTMDGVVATINVKSEGVHTLNVWMREDGFVLDKLVLTVRSGYTPTGEGPAESPRVDSSGVPYQQYSGTDGIISIEAENFDAIASPGSHDWVEVFPAGYSGSDALQALPNMQTNNNTGYVTNSPRLDFLVNFVKTGTHYVWIRGLGANGNDDSVHVGLDGIGLSSSDKIDGFGTDWSWSKSTRDGPVATINVSSAGVHTLNVWMREDGFVLDKLVLTVRSGYTPTGVGPVESPRSN